MPGCDCRYVSLGKHLRTNPNLAPTKKPCRARGGAVHVPLVLVSDAVHHWTPFLMSGLHEKRVKKSVQRNIRSRSVRVLLCRFNAME